MKADYLRQSSIINIGAYRDNKIAIVGCGAIGSFVGIALAKMGLTNFILFDHDKIEAHNLPNQFYTEDDIGQLKTKALAEHMKSFNSDCKIMTLGRFEKDTTLGLPIVVSCVDKMEIRKMIFEQALKDSQFLIDCRMAKFQGQIYSVDLTDKKDVENYRKTLFSDKDAVRLRCTERSIIFTVLGIASMVCNQIVKAFNKEEFPNFICLDYDAVQLF